MWKWLKELFSGSSVRTVGDAEKTLKLGPGMVQYDLRTGKATRVEDTDGGKLWNEIAAGRCPDCGTDKFREGPSGGMSTNIVCQNGHWFNVTPAIGIAERIKR